MTELLDLKITHTEWYHTCDNGCCDDWGVDSVFKVGGKTYKYSGGDRSDTTMAFLYDFFDVDEESHFASQDDGDSYNEDD